MNRIIHKIKAMFDVSFVDSVYKLITFGDFWLVLFPPLMRLYIKNTRKRQRKMIAALKEKPQITVAFFLQTPTTWKYDALYEKMRQSVRFKPVVVICPYNVHLNYSKDECLLVMRQTEEFARSKGFYYISTFNFQKKRWGNIKKILNPDIVFFTKPYKDTLPAYYVYRFREKITCYIPYCVDVLVYRQADSYNLPLHNLLYHFFLETELNVPYAKKSLCGGENVTLSGNLGMEQLMDKNYVPKDVWKPQTILKKRIIWAPHHTLDYLFNISSFLLYYDFMLELALKYEDKIQFAFKPHPVLKFRLINLWGKEKTEAYYSKWENLSNTQLEKGYYADLFLTSDAMIHDSATFTVEYHYTHKPCCFTIKGEHVKKQWNKFGEMAFGLHYHVQNEQEIENFINDVVLNGNDPMLEERKAFYNQYLYPKDGVMPSQKIMQILENDIKKL